jgi:hypothetical protein
MDNEKRKRMMEVNYLKRNVYIKKHIQGYEKEYGNYKIKVQNKAEKKCN